jgi:hypothetical protein
VAVNVSNAVSINAPATGQTVNVSNTVNTTLQTAATGLAVNVSASALPSGAATSANQTTEISSLAVIAAGVTGTGTSASNIEGNVASGVASSGNPLGMGGRAATTSPTGVTDGQRIEAQFTKSGKLVVMSSSIPELVTRTTTTISASTAETTIVAPLASTFWDIDSISVINTDTTNNTRIDFRSTTGGPVVYSMGAAKAFGGFVAPFPVAMLQDAVNTSWTAQCSASTTDIRINIIAHQRK